MIVIVHEHDDHHIRVIERRLKERGASVFIADPAELGSGAELTFDPKSADCVEWRRVDGTSFRSSDASALWFRPGTAATLDVRIRDGVERAFVAREWHELIRAAVTSLDVPTLNPVEAQVRATKPYQLLAARRAGLSTPATVMTNSRTHAAQLVQTSHEVVHKTLSGMERTLATKAWARCEEDHLGELELAPTILQHRVSGTREVRVTAVGTRLFSAEFSTSLVDGRLDRAVRHVRHDLPPSVASSLRRLLDDLALGFASVDLRIDANGDYQFLELNASCAFLWIEIATGLPISAAVADLLLSMSKGREKLS